MLHCLIPLYLNAAFRGLFLPHFMWMKEFLIRGIVLHNFIYFPKSVTTLRMARMFTPHCFSLLTSSHTFVDVSWDFVRERNSAISFQYFSKSLLQLTPLSQCAIELYCKWSEARKSEILLAPQKLSFLPFNSKWWRCES